MFRRRARTGRSGGWEGTGGSPPSGNGASSLHLFWAAPPGRWRAVAATIEVVEAPVVADLHFWALQASFVDASGASAGAGHLGLQHHTPHPGATAVNWGGYGGDGAILDGSRSSLPSATANPHTRDFDWSPARPYRLRIEVVGPAPDGRRTAFRGSVEDLSSGATTVVRDLWAHGERLGSPMVWSEVFARCDAPPSAVRWSQFELVDDDGAVHGAHRVTVNYQSVADGGCVTTSATREGDAFVQRTGVERTTPQGATLELG